MDSTLPGSRRPPTSQTSPHIAKGPILQPTSSHVKTLRLVRWRSRAFRMLLWSSSIFFRRSDGVGHYVVGNHTFEDVDGNYPSAFCIKQVEVRTVA